MSERPPTYAGFRDFLWDVLPEAREHILAEEILWAGEGGPGTYALMSSAFRHALEEAARREDIPLVRRCLAVLERMIAEGDDTLRAAVQIRVLDKDGLTTELPALYRAYAGPLTRAGLGYRGSDLTYLPPDWPPAAPSVADGRPGAAAQAARDWLWERAPASRSYLIAADLAEVRSTTSPAGPSEIRPVMSLAAMTADRYVEAALGGMLADATEAAALGDPEPMDEAVAVLESMPADPGMASFVHRHAGQVPDTRRRGSRPGAAEPR